MLKIGITQIISDKRFYFNEFVKKNCTTNRIIYLNTTPLNYNFVLSKVNINQDTNNNYKKLLENCESAELIQKQSNLFKIYTIQSIYHLLFVAKNLLKKLNLKDYDYIIIDSINHLLCEVDRKQFDYKIITEIFFELKILCFQENIKCLVFSKKLAETNIELINNNLINKNNLFKKLLNLQYNCTITLKKSFDTPFSITTSF